MVLSMMLEPSTSSGELSSSAAALAAGGLLMSVILIPGSAASTVIVYDNPSSASGTILAELTGAANASSVVLAMPSGIYARTGMYVSISGTGAKALISYIRSF